MPRCCPRPPCAPWPAGPSNGRRSLRSLPDALFLGACYQGFPRQSTAARATRPSAGTGRVSTNALTCPTLLLTVTLPPSAQSAPTDSARDPPIRPLPPPEPPGPGAAPVAYAIDPARCLSPTPSTRPGAC